MVYNTVVFKLDSGKTVKQKSWPRHCFLNTSGVELHEKLNILPGSVVVLKGFQLLGIHEQRQNAAD